MTRTLRDYLSDEVVSRPTSTQVMDTLGYLRRDRQENSTPIRLFDPTTIDWLGNEPPSLVVQAPAGEIPVPVSIDSTSDGPGYRFGSSEYHLANTKISGSEVKFDPTYIQGILKAAKDLFSIEHSIRIVNGELISKVILKADIGDSMIELCSDEDSIELDELQA